MNIFCERIEALRKLMAKWGVDAVMLSGSDPHNSEYVAERWKQIEWLCGFSGEGMMTVSLSEAVVYTDSRYFIQAEKELRGTGVKMSKMRVANEMSPEDWLLRQFGGERRVLGVDGACHCYADVERIRRRCGLEIKNIPDFLDALWEDRPVVGAGRIWALDDSVAGVSRREKIALLREFLKMKDLDGIVLSALDEIAWLLNIRGEDVDFNPVVLSYLLVTGERVVWCVSKGVKGDVNQGLAEMEKDGVEVLSYDVKEVFGGGNNIWQGAEGKKWRCAVDKFSLNFDLVDFMERVLPHVVLEDSASPVALWKAVKNTREVEGMREAHVADGIAMEKFLFWLENNVGKVCEGEAAEKLRGFRAESPLYRGESFATISAYGENAALPHYVTPKGGGARIENKGLFLCDSGGQYLFGTTDVTRTVPVGECSAEEREDYTLVLKGHISLAKLLFPKGTAGCQMDVLARMPLWNRMRNFGHGTGHGVGCFLNVHEGPQSIRQNFNSQAFLPGMVTSDEPGIYREGQYGIRHENLLLCKEAGVNEFGEWLGFEVLTLCHFDTSVVVIELLDEEEIAWLNGYNANVFSVLAPLLPPEVKEWLWEKTKPI